MGNLSNSFVRGFGFSLGRSAANSLTSKSKSQPTPQPSFSQKQLALIQEYEDIKKTVLGVLKETELYYTNGKITQGEYNILKSRANDQLVEADAEILKLKSVKAPSSSLGSSILIFIIGLVFFITVINLIKH